MYSEKEVREMLKSAPVLMGEKPVYADTDSVLEEQETTKEKEVEENK